MRYCCLACICREFSFAAGPISSWMVMCTRRVIHVDQHNKAPYPAPCSHCRAQTSVTTATVSAAKRCFWRVSRAACPVLHSGVPTRRRPTHTRLAISEPCNCCPLPPAAAGYGVSHGKCKTCRVANCQACWANAHKCEASLERFLGRCPCLRSVWLAG